LSLKHNLVIQTAFLGDLILSIPALKRIKQIFPEDKLVVVCKNGLGDFLLKEKIVDQVIEVEKSNSRSYSDS
jgi:heptosyltransferase-2